MTIKTKPDKIFLRAYNATYRSEHRERIKKNLEALKTDFKRSDLLFYKENLIDGGNIFFNKPRIFEFKFGKFDGKYIITKENKKFVCEEFLEIFFSPEYLFSCEKLVLKKWGQFYRIDRETSLIQQDSPIDLILRLIESNKKAGRARQWIYPKTGERVNIEFENKN